MKVFVVHHTNFDYKPGHMSLSCNGVFTTWEKALKTAIDIMEPGDEFEYECKECKDQFYTGEEEEEFCNDCRPEREEVKLPSTEEELRRLLPSRGCVWSFENGESAQWWDGDDCGSLLISISYEEVQE